MERWWGWLLVAGDLELSECEHGCRGDLTRPCPQDGGQQREGQGKSGRGGPQALQHPERERSKNSAELQLPLKPELATERIHFESGVLKRLLAQTEITYSNSLIESWWRVLKHQWLYLNTLDTVATVRKLVAFYVEQHNSHLPHSAFQGQTPDEMYFGTGKEIPRDLEVARQSARQLRLQTNRKMSCRTCETVTSIAG